MSCITINTNAFAALAHITVVISHPQLSLEFAAMVLEELVQIMEGCTDPDF